MDIDRLVQLVEAEVRRLLAEQATGPPPQTNPPPSGERNRVLVISVHNSPSDVFLNKLRSEGKEPILWGRNLSIEGFEEIWLANIRWSDVAKMALGIFDTPPLVAVLEILSKGQQVIAEPLPIPSQCPPALRELLKSHWEKLLSLGVVEAQAIQSPLCPPPPAPSRAIITQEDIREAKDKGLGVLILPPRSIVTDMARDLAERLGIQIREEEKS